MSVGVSWYRNGTGGKDCKVRLMNGTTQTMFGGMFFKLATSDDNTTEFETVDRSFPLPKCLVNLTKKEWLSEGKQYYIEGYWNEDKSFTTEFERLLASNNAFNTSKITGNFKNCMNRANIVHDYRLETVSEQYKLFGDNISNQFTKLGCSKDVIKSYWDNVTDKLLISPMQFIGYLGMIEDLIDIIPDYRTTIIDAINSNQVITLGSDFQFLPKTPSAALGILKSFIETR